MELAVHILTLHRNRWSEDLALRARLSSPDHSEEELEKVEDEEEGEEHVYQTLDRKDHFAVTEPVYTLPIKAKVRN